MAHWETGVPIASVAINFSPMESAAQTIGLIGPRLRQHLTHGEAPVEWVQSWDRVLIRGTFRCAGGLRSQSNSSCNFKQISLMLSTAQTSVISTLT